MTGAKRRTPQAINVNAFQISILECLYTGLEMRVWKLFMLSLDYSRRFDLSLFFLFRKQKKNWFLFTDDEKLLNFQLMVAASDAVFLVLNFSWLFYSLLFWDCTLLFCLPLGSSWFHLGHLSLVPFFPLCFRLVYPLCRLHVLSAIFSSFTVCILCSSLPWL